MTVNPYRRRVKDVLSKDLVCVPANATVYEALALMVENRVATLPVVDKRGNCQGILSATDVVELALELSEGLRGFGRAAEESPQWLIDRLAEHDMDRRGVHDVMTTSVATVYLEMPLAVAAREMLRHRVHRLPVVDTQDRLVGIISTMDILNAFADGAESDGK
jgi:CBS domain-containing protein